MRAALLLLVVCGGCEPAPIDVLRPKEGLDTSPSLCAVAGAALCEGFEGTSLGDPPWGLIGYAASAHLDASRSKLGHQSLRVHLEADPGGPDGRIRQGEVTEETAVPAPVEYVRAFVYLPSPGPPSDLRFATAFEHDPPYTGIALWVSDGSLAFSGLDSDFTRHVSATRFPLDTWVCVEWSIGFDGANGSSQVSLDGTEVTDLRFAGPTEAPAGVGRLAFGGGIFGVLTTLPTYDFWIDEIIVDSRQLGCGPPATP